MSSNENRLLARCVEKTQARLRLVGSGQRPAGWGHRVRRNIFAALGALLSCIALVAHGAGVTVITHGLKGNVDGWVSGMANRIPLHHSFPGSSYTFYKIYYYNSGGIYYPTWARFGGVQPSSSDSGEIIVGFDWSQLAHGTNFNTYQIAGSLSAILQNTNFISELNGHALCELPLHLIGHSRGGSLMSETSLRLGTNGVWVDHLTTLDPHPLNNDGFNDSLLYSAIDAPVRTYENVLFHDNYWQEIDWIVYGERVAGAYVRQFYSLYGGYEASEFFYEHANVHLWYHGTVDERNPANDTEALITSTEFGTWYVPYEQYGYDAGFKWSLIGGGNRTSSDQPLGTGTPAIRDGYNQWRDFGAGSLNNRTNLPVKNGSWPNIIKFNLVGSNAVTVGSSVSAKYYYQFGQAASPNAMVELFLDADVNPLNAASGRVFQTNETGTGTSVVRSPTISFNATNPPGQYSVYAKVTGGGHVRYLYAPEKLTINPAPDTTPPMVAITSPAANSRLTNSPVVIVQGTAGDNTQLGSINYQLNGGGWATATGLSNWQATVTLPQGTNLFQVFSTDAAGNKSPTNSLNLVLVLTAPLVVQINGVGTVAPNYHGQMVEIGKSYSMTATAGSGFTFLNWTGSVPTNGPTVQFVMASNLVLTANFVDSQKPTVSITNPASPKTYTNAQTVSISVSAADNVGVTSVGFYDGAVLRGTDTNAPYAYGWSFTGADNGAHVWTARSYDAVGNVTTSSPVTLTVSIDITPPTVAVSSPTNGANLTSSPVTVSGTASDPGSPATGLSVVQLRVNGGVWTNASGTTSWSRSVALLPCGNTIEVRSLDNAGNYSTSAVRAVTYTPPNTVPGTPTNIAPTNGATGVALTLTLQGSAFSDADCVGDTHAASQWQVLNAAGAVIVADSGTTTVNKVSWPVPAGRLYYGSNYQWRVRYRDSRNGWSTNSTATTFTTAGPLLSGTKLGTNMVFRWSTNAPGFTLQWSTNVPVVNWSNATPSPVIVNGNYSVTNSMTNRFRLYRLKK